MKKSLEQIQSSENTLFLGPWWSNCSNRSYYKKATIYFWSTFYPPSLCKIWKKAFIKKIKTVKFQHNHLCQHHLKQFIGLVVDLKTLTKFNLGWNPPFCICLVIKKSSKTNVYTCTYCLQNFVQEFWTCLSYICSENNESLTFARSLF